jgi:hypothetical protein
VFFLLPKAVFFITEGCVFYYRRLCFLLLKAVFFLRFITEGCVFPQVGRGVLSAALMLAAKV